MAMIIAIDGIVLKDSASRQAMSHHAYDEDLAYVHDVGFGHVARNAAVELLERLRANRIGTGLVVDLGCGTGILAEQVTKVGFEVLGFELSKAALEIARRRAPKAAFRHASFLEADIPRCVAVTATGEVFNYLFDPHNSPSAFQKLVNRVHDALAPGGLFMFDLATVGRGPAGEWRRTYFDGKDWVCVVSTREDRASRMLTRQIGTFRKVGKLYRRSDETHRQRLIGASHAISAVRKAGFFAHTIHRYGKFALGRGWYGVVCRKRLVPPQRQ
jgi:SAM-dependent methyltransferase